LGCHDGLDARSCASYSVPLTRSEEIQVKTFSSDFAFTMFQHMLLCKAVNSNPIDRPK
jgi:hypothetical protein